MNKIKSASIGAWEVKLEIMTYGPTDRQTDILGHREVLLPKENNKKYIFPWNPLHFD